MELPDTVLVRRGVVMSYLGVDDRVMSALVAAKVLKPFYPPLPRNGKKKTARAFFFREQVIRVFKDLGNVGKVSASGKVTTLNNKK